MPETNAQIKYICIHGANHGGSTLLGASKQYNEHPHVGEVHAFFTEIPYFAGKHKFWNYENHHFGGSRAVTRMLQGNSPGEIIPQESNTVLYKELASWMDSKTDHSRH